MAWQRLLAVVLAPYVLWLVFAYEVHFLDGVNLAFHEAGHVFLALFGQTLHVLGGTLGQLFFPALLAFRFRARGDVFAGSVCGIWLGESLMNVAVYLGDARAQALPLVGGHMHDWLWLLSHAGLLAHCEGIARGLHGIASGLVLYAWLRATRVAFAPALPAQEVTPAAPEGSAAPARRASPGSGSGPGRRAARARPT
jgi:hypothetical protein